MTTPFLKNAFVTQLTPIERESYQFASTYLKDVFSLPKSNAYLEWLRSKQTKSTIQIQKWWRRRAKEWDSNKGTTLYHCLVYHMRDK